MRYTMQVTIHVNGLDEAASAERALREEFGNNATVDGLYAYQAPFHGGSVVETLSALTLAAPPEENGDEPPQEPSVPATEISMSDAIERATAFARINGSPALLEVLKSFDVKRVSELAPEQLAPFVAKVQ